MAVSWQHPTSPQAPAGWARWRTLAVGILLTAYFAWFARTAFWANFAPDDLMNIHYCWRLPAWERVLGPFMLWRPLYRPMAAWFLLPVLSGFGLNPAAFRAEMLAVLLAGAFLIYGLSLRLGCGERAALLTALVACYHAGLNNLYYNVAFIYDALCGFFFVAALFYYVRIRERGGIPNWRQTAVFLSLFLAALDSKEMAVTLPAVLLLYEWVYHPPGLLWRPRELARWLRGPGRCALAGAGLDLAFVWGRVEGSGGLAHQPGYHLELSMARAWDFQLRSFADLLEKWQYFGRWGIVALWMAMFAIAWLRKRPVLRFACLFLLVAPLPIEFLSGRAEGCLYLPMLALALFVTVVFVDAADAAAHVVAWALPAAPDFRRLSRAWISGVLVAAGAMCWAYHNDDLKRRYVDPITADFAPATGSAIRQLRAFHLDPRPQSTIAFLNDPFGTWHMLFIAELEFRDRPLNVELNRQTPLSAEEIARADIVFDYREGRLVRVR